MILRKQKKWLEFFIRLLPVFIFLFVLVMNIFNTNQANSQTIDFATIISNSFNQITDFFKFFNNNNGTILSDIYDSLNAWAVDIIDISQSSGKVIFDFLYYQLLISIMFLFFDFLNFIIDWARQFLGGFYAKEK